MQTKLYINGEFISGEGRDETILDPAIGDVLTTVAEASAEQIDRAVAAASTAFAATGPVTPRQRSKNSIPALFSWRPSVAARSMLVELWRPVVTTSLAIVIGFSVMNLAELATLEAVQPPRIDLRAMVATPGRTARLAQD